MSPERAEDGAAGFRRLGTTPQFRGRVVEHWSVEVLSPRGVRLERDAVHHPGAVVVVPVTDSDTVLLVRQYRAAPDAVVLELPAGKRDVDGEPPEETAARELAEELGWRPGRVERLGGFYTSPGFCDEWALCYLASELTPVAADPQGEEEHFLEVVEMSVEEAWRAVRDGRLVDAKSLAGLTLAAGVRGWAGRWPASGG